MGGQRRPRASYHRGAEGRGTDLDVELRLLEELAGRVGIEVRYEAMEDDGSSSAGGLCRLRSRELLIIDRNAPLAERVGVLLDALGSLDLESTWVPPAIRRELDRRASRKAGD